MSSMTQIDEGNESLNGLFPHQDVTVVHNCVRLVTVFTDSTGELLRLKIKTSIKKYQHDFNISVFLQDALSTQAV